MSTTFYITMFFVVSSGLIFSVFTAYFLRSYIAHQNTQIVLLKQSLAEVQAELRSLRQSISVHRGLAAEKLYPLKFDCPYTPRDMQFIGKPFDYLVLKGYDDDNVEEIVFLEIKTGKSQLSSIQRSIRDCVNSGRVSWKTTAINEYTGDTNEPKHITECTTEN